jgi:hypothetical protein
VDEDGNPVELEDYEKEGDGGVGDEGLTETRLEDAESVVKAEAAAAEPAQTAEGAEAVKEEETPNGKKGRSKRTPKKAAASAA